MVIQLDTCLISFRNFNEWVVGTPLVKGDHRMGYLGKTICSYRIVFALKNE